MTKKKPNGEISPFRFYWSSLSTHLKGLLKSAMPDIQMYVEYTNTVFKPEFIRSMSYDMNNTSFDMTSLWQQVTIQESTLRKTEADHGV